MNIGLYNMRFSCESIIATLDKSMILHRDGVAWLLETTPDDQISTIYRFLWLPLINVKLYCSCLNCLYYP